MTILNNMGRYIRLMFGTSFNTSTRLAPGASSGLRFNDFYALAAGHRTRPKTSLSSNITGVASDTDVSITPLAFPNNVSNLPNSTDATGFFRNAYIINENFSIVDNEYILGETSGTGQQPVKIWLSISATMDVGSLKTVYSLTYSNTGEENVNVYGFCFVGNIEGFIYTGSVWSGQASSSWEVPMAVVKFDQPKVVEAGGVLQMSYTIDFSNLISEANEIVVTQQ